MHVVVYVSVLTHICAYTRAPPPSPFVQAEGGGKKERFVLSVAFSPDKQLLAAGAMDGTIAGTLQKQYGRQNAKGSTV
jgi:hypothetical protein